MSGFVCPPPHRGLVPGSPGHSFAIAVCVVFPILLIIAGTWFKLAQKSSVFLRKRSFKIILATSIGGMAAWSITAVYDVVGPEKYPCTLFGLLNIMFILMINMPPLFALAQYRNEVAAFLISTKRYGRSSFTSISAAKSDEDLTRSISWAQAFHGHVKTTFGSKDPIDRLRHAKFARSIQFKVFYATINIIPYAIYFVIKLANDPQYHNGCYGCELTTVDAAFLLSMAVFGCGMGVGLNSARLSRKDALRIVRECVFVWLSSGVFIVVAFVLYLTDPGNAYANGQFNYRILILLGALFPVYIQSVHQVIMAQRLRADLVTSNVINQAELFHDVMNDKDLKADLKMHLTSELSGEIVPFLDSVESFKASFDKSTDNDQKARWILETFIQRNSPLEINISGAARSRLLDLMATNEYDIAMFDQAYEEVKGSLLTDGFARYVRGRRMKRQQQKAMTTRSSIGVLVTSVFGETIADSLLPSSKKSADPSVLPEDTATQPPLI